MAITIGNINPVNAVPATVTGADNGLTLNAGIVELGGNLIKNTPIVSNGFAFQGQWAGPGGTSQIAFSDALHFLLRQFGAVATTQYFLTMDLGGLILGMTDGVGLAQFRINSAGQLQLTDTVNNVGIVNQGDYSANIIATANALASTKAVQLLINAVFNPALYALIAGQVFTGAISATNLSGTNTGDQNLTPYALVVNTGQIVSSAKLAAVTATVNLLVYNVPAANAMYRVSLYFSQTAFTAGLISVNVLYTNFAGTGETVLLTSSNSVQDIAVQVRSINAKASTTITIAITVTGTGTANIGGCLEFMF